MSKTNDFLGFDIVSKLGEGAFSTTYLGKQDNRKVAIKIIEIPNPHTSKKLSPDEIKGVDFQNSLRKTSAQLNDILRTLVATNDRKGILRYFDYHISVDPQNHTYQLGILTEYLDNLSAYLKLSDMRVRQVIKLGMDLCDGLDRLANIGIFHGNIKESNIFYDKVKGYKLGDFFFNDVLIQSLEPNEDYGDYGYRFLAPEAYDNKAYTFHTDMFTLSILLYKLLNNGSLPYDVESINMSVKDIREKFIESKTLPSSPFIEEPVLKVLNKAAAFDMKNRYDSFLDFRLALREAMGETELSSLDRIITVGKISTTFIPVPAPEEAKNDENDEDELLPPNMIKRENNILEGVPFTISLGGEKPLPQILDPESGETSSLVPSRMRNSQRVYDKGKQDMVIYGSTDELETKIASSGYTPGHYESIILDEITEEIEKTRFDYSDEEVHDYKFTQEDLADDNVKNHVSTVVFIFALVLIVVVFIIIFPYITEFFSGGK